MGPAGAHTGAQAAAQQFHKWICSVQCPALAAAQCPLTGLTSRASQSPVSNSGTKEKKDLFSSTKDEFCIKTALSMCTLDMKIIDNSCTIISATQVPHHCWEHFKSTKKQEFICHTAQVSWKPKPLLKNICWQILTTTRLSQGSPVSQ